MPPPDLSQQDSLALSQDKALAQSGIDPSQPSSASAFLEDELGGYYHRLGTEEWRKQRQAETKLDAEHATDNMAKGNDSSGDEESGESASQQQQEQRRQQLHKEQETRR